MASCGLYPNKSSCPGYKHEGYSACKDCEYIDTPYSVQDNEQSPVIKKTTSTQTSTPLPTDKDAPAQSTPKHYDVTPVNDGAIAFAKRILEQEIILPFHRGIKYDKGKMLNEDDADFVKEYFDTLGDYLAKKRKVSSGYPLESDRAEYKSVVLSLYRSLQSKYPRLIYNIDDNCDVRASEDFKRYSDAMTKAIKKIFGQTACDFRVPELCKTSPKIAFCDYYSKDKFSLRTNNSLTSYMYKNESNIYIDDLLSLFIDRSVVSCMIDERAYYTVADKSSAEEFDSQRKAIIHSHEIDSMWAKAKPIAKEALASAEIITKYADDNGCSFKAALTDFITNYSLSPKENERTR